MTHCQPKSEPRNERAHQRGATMSSMVLGYRLALLTPIAFQHQGLTALQGRGLLPASGEGRYSAAARRIIWSRPSCLRDAWCWLAMGSCPVGVSPTLKNFFTMTQKGT